MSDKNITDLDVYSLLEICEYLKTIPDQLSFARTCKIFEDVYRIYCQHRNVYKVCPKNTDNLTPADIDTFMHFAGPNIEECFDIDMSDGLIRNPENARIKSITVCIDGDENLSYYHNIAKLKTLEEARIQVYRIQKNTSILCDSLQQLPCLRKLYLIGELSDFQPTTEWPSIEELLVEHEELSLGKFIRGCTKMINLRVFYINDRLTSRHLRLISDHCKNLEELGISLNKNCDQGLIAKFTKLKFLSISNAMLRHKFITTLAKRRPQQLEYLELRYCVLFGVEPDHIEHRINGIRQLCLKIVHSELEVLANFFSNLEVITISCTSKMDDVLLKIIETNKTLRLIELDCLEANISLRFVYGVTIYFQRKPEMIYPIYIKDPAYIEHCTSTFISTTHLKFINDEHKLPEDLVINKTFKLAAIGMH